MGKRFLVVDEHWCSRAATRLALSLKGHRCLAVATALEALDAVDNFAPEVVLLEWDFRDGSGIGLARQMRNRAAANGRSLIVIATSARPEMLVIRGCEELDAYLVKPASILEVEATLASILDVSTRPYESR